MLKIQIFLCVLLCSITYSQTSFNVDLLGSLNPYPDKAYASLWGYTSDDKREYALLGVEHGTSIIDITDPENPVEAAFIPGPPRPPYHWREMKTHSHYAYIVSEGFGTGAGMQIVDLSYLPDSAVLVNTYTEMFTTAHNIYIDNGYAYVVGASGVGGIHILDLSNPEEPEWKTQYTASGYVHDVYVWNDTAYASSENTYDLVDVSDKSNPVLVSQSAALPGIYAHSGWLTEDKRYFIACEEFNIRDLTVWDLQDRNTWNLVVPSWHMPGNSPIHNVYVKGDYAHIAYYREGYVVLNISDPSNPLLAGQYNTYTTGGTYSGAWNCYPYFESGSVIISDMQTGLYVFNFNPGAVLVDDETKIPDQYILNQNYPNPFNPTTRISFNIPQNSFTSLKVYDVLGNEVANIIDEELTAGSHIIEFNASGLSSGVYYYTIRSGNFVQSRKMLLLK